MSLGPLMIDVGGCELTSAERERLRHPLVGGVILFTRNFESVEQLAALTAAIHAVRSPPLLIAVDHEGGRVQRFREGFTRLPPMRALGRIWDQRPARAKSLAEQTGYVLAAELRACGVDFSFTPVLDLDYGASSVIGDRAFHRSPSVVAAIAHSLMVGLRHGGCAAVGKHFPGHGYVAADSHTDLPVDERPLADLRASDFLAFKQMIEYGMPALMPAHVVYPQVDAAPAGFSRVWLQKILRELLGFEGSVFSDDLCMKGACGVGDMTARTRAALEAGCDMALICNDPAAADRVLTELRWESSPVSLARLARMHGRAHAEGWVRLRESPEYVTSVRAVAALAAEAAEVPLLADPTEPGPRGA
ncbi:MAG TPA: beta-N-acetylhexosaminidase [Pelomicrobium sp.]|nr:beta-N-acetylhexosaminidase [Pelomicrobium sp.]